MVNWTEVEAIANSFLVLTSASAIGYAGLQLKHERQYRSVTNLEKQLGFFQGEGFVKARRKLAESRLCENGRELRPWELDEPPVSSFEVLDFYEHIGLLVKKGHLEAYDVWHTFYEWAQPVYVDMRPLIEDPASAYSDHYSDLRRLMKEMDNLQLSRMDKQSADHGALWTPDRILEHYRYELEVAGYSGLGKRSAERRATRQRVEQERIEIQAAAAARMAMKTRDTSEDEDVAQRELEKMRDA